MTPPTMAPVCLDEEVVRVDLGEDNRAVEEAGSVIVSEEETDREGE